MVRCCGIFIILVFTLGVFFQGKAVSLPSDEIKGLKQAREFEKAEALLVSQLQSWEQFTPVQQLELTNSAADLMASQWRWSEGLKILQAGSEILVDWKALNPADSLLLSRRYSILGDIFYSYSYFSTSKTQRQNCLSFYQLAAAFYPYPELESQLLRKTGMILRLLKQQDEAVEFLYKALEASEENSSERVRCHQRLGFAYYRTRARETANHHFHIADSLIRYQPPSDLTSEDSIYQWYGVGSLKGEKSLFKKIADRLKQSPCYDLTQMAAISKLGNAAFIEGKFTTALEHYHLMQDWYSRTPQTLWRQLTLKDNIANSWMELGDLNMALPYYQGEVDILEGMGKLDNLNSQLLARAYHNLAGCLFKLYGDRSIVPILIKAVELNTHQEEPPEDLGRLHSSLGYVYRDSRHFSKALLHYMNSNQCLAPLGERKWPEIAVNHASMAFCFLDLGQPEAAEINILKAEDILQKVQSSSDQIAKATAANIIGEFHLNAGAYEAAAASFQRALAFLSADFKPTDIIDNPSMESISVVGEALDARFGKAKAIRRMAQSGQQDSLLKNCLNQFPGTIELIHAMRQGQSAEASQIRFSARTRPIFETALDVAWDHFQQTGNPEALKIAFGQAEQSRSMVLLAAISSQEAARTAGLPDHYVLAQRDLQSQKDQWLRLKSEQNGSASLINQELVQITRQQDSLLGIIRDSFPRYYELVYETSTVPVENIQRDLRASNAALVEYFYGDSLLFNFTITPDTFVVRRERIDNQFLDDFDLVQSVMIDKYLPDDALAYQEAAHRMYQTLFGSDGIQLPEKLIVIPDGRLNYLSFEALVSEEKQSESPHFLDLHYVLDDHIVAYDYSYTVRAKRGVHTPSSKGILAMAPSQTEGLADLPRARENVKQLQKTFKGVTTLVGDEATESTFREFAPQYNILDLATHGSMDTLNPMDCRLYFKGDSEGDGRLYLGELYNMDLNARMAILEACESGIGKDMQGEGVMSLARGFTYAGCQTIVTSLWNVAEEEITAEIMEQFYQALADGEPVDEALTHSKRNYLAQIREQKGSSSQFFKPFFWAEMVIIGDTSPVYLQRKSNWGTLGWVALGLLGLVIGFWAYNKLIPKS